MTDKADNMELQEEIEPEVSESENTEEIETDSEVEDDSAESEEESDPLKDAEEKLQAAKEEAKESHDRSLRISAEFENYKKRSLREMSDFRKFANEALIRDFLTVVDNLERAILSSEENSNDNSGVAQGVNMTLKEILKIFKKFNVQPVESDGKPFDPSFHQAMMQEESADHPENTVIKELQKGYKLHDRLLRPAMVVVSKAKATDTKKDKSKKKKKEK